jgi:hypothetical protein
MSFKKYSSRIVLTAVILLGLCTQGFWAPRPTAAQSGAKPVGQVTFSRGLSIDGKDATAGQTIFDGARMTVVDGGMGIFNLGPYGRIEVGSNSEFILQMDGNNIGGELLSGCMQANAASGSAIRIKSPLGTSSTPGRQPSGFTLGLKGDYLHVISDLGDTTVTAGNKTGMVNAGQYLSVRNKNGDPVFSNPAMSSECGPAGQVSCTCRTGALAGKGPGGKSGGGGGGGGVGPAIIAAIIGGAGATATGIVTQGGSGVRCRGVFGANCIAISRRGF